MTDNTDSGTSSAGMGESREAPSAAVFPIAEALYHVRCLADFAYECGYREFGYDPVTVLRARLAEYDKLAKRAREVQGLFLAEPFDQTVASQVIGWCERITHDLAALAEVE